MSIENLSGWIGALLVLIAYYMVTSGKAKADSTGFQLINIIGASFLIYYTYSFRAYASMSVNIIWVLIGIGSFKKFIKLKGFRMENTINVLREGAVMKLKTKLVFTIISAVLIMSISSHSFAQEMESKDSDLISVAAKSNTSHISDEISDAEEDMNSEIEEEETYSVDGSEDPEVSEDESD